MFYSISNPRLKKGLTVFPWIQFSWNFKTDWNILFMTGENMAMRQGILGQQRRLRWRRRLRAMRTPVKR